MLFHVTALEAKLLTLVVASTTPLIVTMICVFIVHARHFAVAYSIALIKASMLSVLTKPIISGFLSSGIHAESSSPIVNADLVS